MELVGMVQLDTALEALGPRTGPAMVELEEATAGTEVWARMAV